jgi:hypothetical protein
MRKSLVAYLSAPIRPNFASTNPYGSIANRQQHNISSLLDPNVVMMTNAAATIAAVTASAVQQINQAKAAPPHTSAQSSLAAALNARNSLLSHPHHATAGAANPSASQLAALLGAAAAPQNSLHAGHAASLQQFLGLGDRRQTSTTQQQAAPALASPAVSNAMFPSMQTWSLEKLGKKEKGVEVHISALFYFFGSPISTFRRATC